jgi:hypothetical protein
MTAVDSLADLALSSAVEAAPGTAQGRRLQSATVQKTLPYDTALVVYQSINAGVKYKPHSAGAGSVVFYAGQTVGALALSVDHLGLRFSTKAVTSGKLRLVLSDVTRAAAMAGACKKSHAKALLDAIVSDPWSAQGSAVAPAGGSGAVDRELKSSSEITILVGGNYRVCYSEDGTFDQADIVNVTISAKGAQQLDVYNCSDDCIRLKKHYCYAMKRSYNNAGNTNIGSSCEVNLGNSFIGMAERGSWTSLFGATYPTAQAIYDVGTTVTTSPAACTTPPAGFIGPPIGTQGCLSGGVTSVKLGASGADLTIPLPPTRNDLGTCGNLGFPIPALAGKAYTVAACYCPDYEGCDDITDFLQQVGILYFYTTQTCGHGQEALQCNPGDYTGTATPFRFFTEGALSSRCM